MRFRLYSFLPVGKCQICYGISCMVRLKIKRFGRFLMLMTNFISQQ